MAAALLRRGSFRPTDRGPSKTEPSTFLLILLQRRVFQFFLSFLAKQMQKAESKANCFLGRQRQKKTRVGERMENRLRTDEKTIAEIFRRLALFVPFLRRLGCFCVPFKLGAADRPAGRDDVIDPSDQLFTLATRSRCEKSKVVQIWSFGFVWSSCRVAVKNFDFHLDWIVFSMCGTKRNYIPISRGDKERPAGFFFARKPKRLNQFVNHIVRFGRLRRESHK